MTVLIPFRRIPFQSFSCEYVRFLSCSKIKPSHSREYKFKTVAGQLNFQSEKFILLSKSVVPSSLSYMRRNGTNSVGSEAFNFQKVCDETLDSLCEYFEDLVEQNPNLISADVSYGDGVLTVNFSNSHGTYVINRQSPNRQIWLSSPTSGPKRYDFSPSENSWIYKHNNESLHALLQVEIPKIVKQEVDFFQCAYSGKNSN